MIYKYKATLPGIKVFMREYEIKGEMTLYSLHEYLIGDLEFSPDQMVLFKGVDLNGNVKSEYGLFDLGYGSLDSVKLEKTVAKGENLLHYIFDIFEKRYLILELLGEVDVQPRAHYPRLVAEKGRNPDQFSKDYDDFDELENIIKPKEEPFEEQEEPGEEDGEDMDIDVFNSEDISFTDIE